MSFPHHTDPFERLLDQAEADNKRLRDALGTIAKMAVFDEQAYEYDPAFNACVKLARQVLGDATWHEGMRWSRCGECGVPIFEHRTWSHQGGTAETDHDAAPKEE